MSSSLSDPAACERIAAQCEAEAAHIDPICWHAAKLFREAAALLRERAEPPQWQPIETAPKDCELLLYGEYTSGAKGLVQGAWNHGGAMFGPHWMGGIIRPTHWMPLPSPPEVS